MEHVCGPECKCKIDAAVEALEQAAALLRSSILSDSDDFMANAYALVRSAKARLQGAMADYQDHFADIAR